MPALRVQIPQVQDLKDEKEKLEREKQTLEGEKQKLKDKVAALEAGADAALHKEVAERAAGSSGRHYAQLRKALSSCTRQG